MFKVKASIPIQHLYVKNKTVPSRHLLGFFLFFSYMNMNSILESVWCGVVWCGVVCVVCVCLCV